MKTTTFMCGFSCWHPGWLQQFANSKAFLVVYGLLGTIQAMSYLYFVITLTTIERRFKIPSQTTGLMLSGNEISQILLSLVLSYVGGQRNRPRWIGIGVIFSALSCFILALPHFIYGAGDEALRLTKEYSLTNKVDMSSLNRTSTEIYRSRNYLCMALQQPDGCDEYFSTVPIVLIFLSQFVLGIGNTLYYSLGQTYLDDNTKKTNTPMMLAYAMALRMLGPVVGFGLGAGSLKVYIDPSKTPLIDSTDPRWMGAWWLGWIILGLAMLIFAFLISLFPKELKKRQPDVPINRLLKDVKEQETLLENGIRNVPEKSLSFENLGSATFRGSMLEIPQMKDFPTALKRLFKNKILMCNIVSTVFYILGASGYMTFMAKYMEVQFNKSSSDSTIITGPITLVGMVVGLLGSGFVITKFKPSASKLLFWNVIVGIFFILGEASYLFLTCENENIPLVNSKLANLTTTCNMKCDCDRIPYSPVCDLKTDTTYFSACHAGCNQFNEKSRVYSECGCSSDIIPYQPVSPYRGQIQPTMNKDEFGDYETTTDYLDLTDYYNTQTTQSSSVVTEDVLWSRRKRQTQTDDGLLSTMVPGVCMKGCAYGFFMFAIVSMIINCFGSSGRITNLLINYRCVEKRDKSFSQGLFLMMMSLFAMIPGPILYGWIIDKSCLAWNFKCNELGNCQLYDQKLFRYYINFTAMGLTSIAVIFDTFVWYFGRNVDLYVENENKIEKVQT